MATRNYRKEYDNYQGTTAQKRRRAQRNKARRLMIRKGKAKKGDGKDIAHKDNNPFNSALKNLTSQLRGKNRSFKRNKNAGRR